jgi:uncharacterized protein (TIGR02646 family)
VRHIVKRREPLALTNYRAFAGAKFDGDNGFPPVKQAIREASIAEQRGICGFCEQRIEATNDSMRIAHRVPQSVDPARDLDWQNMLAACRGNEGSIPTHCDVAQRNTPIQLDPTQQTHCATLGFDGDRLVSSNAQFVREIDDVLALNSDMMRDRRRRTLEAFIRASFEGRGSVDHKVLERMKKKLSSAGPLPAFFSYLESWVDEKITQRKTAPRGVGARKR